jgi:tRNA:m4X modification enzyme
LFKKSQKCLLYGKHLCGVATDYALRCLKYSLESSFETHQPIKTSGLVLAVCCHHQCEWESFCGKGFFEELNIDSKMFYILRSMTSWCAQSNETNKQVKDGL